MSLANTNLVSGANKPRYATVSYNGVLLENILKSEVRSEPVYNQAETGVKYVTHTIEVEAIVYAGQLESATTTTDASMQILRNKLLTPCRSLTYQDKGFGDFTIVWSPQSNRGTLNGDTVQQDVADGPKPRMLVFDPYGGAASSNVNYAGVQVARIVWTVEVNTNEKCGIDKGLNEFWVTSSVSINKSGYQTITRKGYAELSGSTDLLNRRRDQSAEDFIRSQNFRSLIADNLWGFNLSQSYSYTPNNRGVEFELVYEEIESPNFYPKYVVEIDCDHNMRSELMSSDPLSQGFKNWMNTMNCRIKLAPKVPREYAWTIFSLIATQRINMGVEVEVENEDGKRIITIIRVPIILSMDITEDLFDDTCSFNVTWTSSAKTIAEIFGNTGMFKPLQPQAPFLEGWQEWTYSMNNIGQNPEGAFPVSGTGQSRNVVDSCNQVPLLDFIDGSQFKTFDYLRRTALFNLERPPKEASYLAFDNDVHIEEKIGKSLFNRYEEGDIVRGDYNESDEYGDEFKPTTESQRKPRIIPYFKQEYGNDKYVAVLSGRAARVGYSIEPPELKSIGGIDVEYDEEGSTISTTTLGTGSTIPVYLATWVRRYRILGTPKGDMTEAIITTGNKGGKL
jgi:hypothetical protein